MRIDFQSSRLLALLIVCGLSLGCGTSNEISEIGGGAADDPLKFNPIQVVKPFPAITKFPIVKANAANKKIGPAELVLGVTVNGKSRAYPINMLTGPRREIINDQLGGRPIAATW